jgi:O-acetyl-ADP-ribose deacetylase (regulator of RNase III)
MNLQLVHGDLLDQDVDVIVNAWNRNIIAWWLLLPQGVSGAIKRRGGTGPFKELAKHGPIPLGGAVLTSAGRLPFKAIIHVAGINMLWRASEWSIRQCVRNAMALAQEKGFKSIAFPLIGAGSGSFNQDRAKAIMEDELGKMESGMEVTLVVFKKGRQTKGMDSTMKKHPSQSDLMTVEAETYRLLDTTGLPYKRVSAFNLIDQDQSPNGAKAVWNGDPGQDTGSIDIYFGCDAEAVAHEIGHGFHERLYHEYWIREKALPKEIRYPEDGQAFAEAVRFFVEQGRGSAWRPANDTQVLDYCDYDLHRFVALCQSGL